MISADEKEKRENIQDESCSNGRDQDVFIMEQRRDVFCRVFALVCHDSEENEQVCQEKIDL